VPAAPVPAELFAFPAAVISAGPRSTVGVIDGLAHLALTPGVLARLMAPFPVAGPAQYGQDFHESRQLPTPHLHEGTDIAAAQGTPVVASGSGAVELITTDPEGGNGINLRSADGNLYYYAHLEAFAPGLVNGARVDRGDIIGTVGTTGFSTGPHLHFEIHPGGAAAVDPVPYLDRWLAQASATARAMGGAPQEDFLGALLGRNPTPSVAPAVVVGTGHSGFSVDHVATAPAVSSHRLGAITGVSSVSSMTVLAIALTVIAFIVLRRRQSRGLAAELSAAGRRRVPVGFDAADPLWSARREVRARASETV
jgi:hypothetical protein